MARARGLWLLSLGALIASASAASADDFALKTGDRVVFYGDSITDQRLYTTFVEDYAVTRFPALDLRFVHSGWGGDRVTGGGGGSVDVRLDRDVLAYKPTVFTCMLGMNDASYRAFDEKIFETYSSGLAHIVSRVKAGAPDARITLIEPSPYDDFTRAPGLKDGASYNDVLLKYGEFARELAAREKTGVADLNSALASCLRSANAKDPKVALKILPDRVHPGASGHLVMARALLGAWNAPALVSGVTIDAAEKKVGALENATVKDLSAEGTISWESLEGALPLAWDLKDPVFTLVTETSDVVAALDQETLRVTGLTAADYTLKIDDQKIDTFPREKWAEGVNLATLATPMHAQSLAVHSLTLKHNEIHFQRWRTLQVLLPKEASPLPDLPKALEALDALEEDVVLAQRAKAKPVPHKFQLVPMH